MDQIIFNSENIREENFYPFTLTRKVEDLYMGMMTIRERWERLLKRKTGGKEVQFVINANLLPTAALLSTVKKLRPGDSITDIDGNILVHRPYKQGRRKIIPEDFFQIIEHEPLQLHYGWDIFRLNDQMLRFDFKWLTKGHKSAPAGVSNYISNTKNFFAEKGAVVKNCIINTDEGPVYISKNTLVMEGSCLRGPLYIGAGAVVKMGAKIYGATSIGPGCTVGGEIKNTVFFGYSNKAHDGYLGDSVLGEWCNMGAGTTASNLKNTAANINVHLPGKVHAVGNKCGVLMGDFSRTAINTSINSGTVIGVNAHVFGKGLTPKYIPSFSWGFDAPEKYKLDKALQDANAWKQLKKQELTTTEKQKLETIYNNLK